MSEPIKVSCHCGAVAIELITAPAEVVKCNCSLCRAYGVVWAYFEVDDISIPVGAETATYAWNGKNVDFHRCHSCGCVTHWMPRDTARDRRGVNANLIPPDQLHSAKVRYRDGANTGKYLD